LTACQPTDPQNTTIPATTAKATQLKSVAADCVVLAAAQQAYMIVVMASTTPNGSSPTLLRRRAGCPRRRGACPTPSAH